jgi:hypothetical protein
VNCEDDLFFSEYGDYRVGAVFDGCSTGMKSHFASSLFSKVLNRVLKTKTYPMFDSGDYYLDDIARETFIKFFYKLKEVKHILDLQDLEIVSTLILTIIKGDEAFIIVSGDGCIAMDEEETKIESDNNTPDYIAYHLDEPGIEVYNHCVRRYGYTGLRKGLCISSDGVYSFRNPDQSRLMIEARDFLFNDPSLMTSEAMLARKYNILTKQGFSNFDDLSIVRFIL